MLRLRTDLVLRTELLSSLGMRPRIRNLPNASCVHPKGAEAKSFPQITFVIKTHERPICALHTVACIRELHPLSPIIIADDSAFPRIIDLPNVQHIILKFDVGLSAGRNALLQAVSTPYFVLFDDDFIVSGGFLERWYDVMQAANADIVGGRAGLDFAGRFATMDNNTTLLLTEGNYGRVRGCIVVDFLPNFYLARTARVRGLVGGWHPLLKLGEHEDFFWRAHLARLKVVYCRDVTVSNSPEQCRTTQSGRERAAAMERRNYAYEFITMGLQRHGFRHLGYCLSPPFLRGDGDIVRGPRGQKCRILPTSYIHSLHPFPKRLSSGVRAHPYMLDHMPQLPPAAATVATTPDASTVASVPSHPSDSANGGAALATGGTPLLQEYEEQLSRQRAAQLPPGMALRPVQRVLFLVSSSAFVGYLDRSVFHFFDAVRKHPWVHAQIWGPGFNGWDPRLPFSDNILRRYGTRSFFDLVVLGVLRGFQAHAAALARTTTTVSLKYGCSSMECHDTLSLVPSRIVLFAQAADMQAAAAAAPAHRRVYMHAPITASAPLFFAPVAADRPIDIAIIGVLHLAEYPGLNALLKVAQAMKGVRVYHVQHPGYYDRLSTTELAAHGVTLTAKYMEEQMQKYASVLQQSKIVITGGDARHYATKRFAEAAMSGALILSPHMPSEFRQDLQRFVVSLRDDLSDPSAIRARFRYWLTHASHRQARALRGQRITLQKFTFAHRADLLLRAYALLRRGRYGLHFPYPHARVCTRGPTAVVHGKSSAAGNLGTAAATTDATTADAAASTTDSTAVAAAAAAAALSSDQCEIP